MKLWLLPLIFATAGSAAASKGKCGSWTAHGHVADKALRFDRLLEHLQTSPNPEVDLAKFAAKEGLPLTLPRPSGPSVPAERLESKDRGEIVVFRTSLPSTTTGSVFYEFANPRAGKPLHKWTAPGLQALPGDVQGDEMIFKFSLQSLCGSKNFWSAGLAVKPSGRFRVVPYKNDQYPSIVSNCPASGTVFKTSPYSTCGEVTDSKKRKRLLVYQLTKE